MPSPIPYTRASLPPNVTSGAIRTPQATVAVFVSSPPEDTQSQPQPAKQKPTLLLIHGNSTSSLFFRDVFASPLAKTHKIVALDLPGHGASGDADEAFGYRNVYTQRSYARVALQVLEEAAGGGEVVVLGWSLGGHVAVEMCDLLAGEEGAAAHPTVKIRAICITGTPPVPLRDIDVGFAPADKLSAAATASLTPEVINAFAHGMTVGPYEPWMHDCVRRTDGRAREVMFATFRDGSGACDQKARVEAMTSQRGADGTLVAVINGVHDPYVNVKWIREGVQWGRGLWRGKCIEFEGSDKVPVAHASFWEDWEAFWPLLRDLMADVEERN